ncbi:hypothetical protein [Bradyrhizobium sp. AZCC 2230]|uniref:hypothetical protein n=1 Tax=Bradyrhizobium sp. AZCC 2230 TaxID=3117021 RepID=UPI002FF2376F
METENSLETILQDDLGRQEKHSVAFNQYHRQFLNHLRDADWIACMKLPDTPRTTLTLLRNGWIEQRATKDGIEYRITKAGLTELSRPR